MYLYTPKKSILRHFEPIEWGYCSFPYLSSDKYVKVLKDHCVSMDYRVRWSDFVRTYPNVQFYSKTRRREVPVNGYLFPVALFDEEIVK